MPDINGISVQDDTELSRKHFDPETLSAGDKGITLAPPFEQSLGKSSGKMQTV